MKDYSSISDFRLNEQVALWMGVYESGGHSEEVTDFIGKVIYKDRDGRSCRFDPCNSWADAGPIIAEHGIGVAPYKRSNAYAWDSSKGMAYGINFEDENPLRAAMIVFLMMKGAEK